MHTSYMARGGLQDMEAGVLLDLTSTSCSVEDATTAKSSIVLNHCNNGADSNSNNCSFNSHSHSHPQEKRSTAAAAIDGLCFPTSRVRRLIRSEGNLRTTQEAVFLINKASEKFLQQFADDAYCCAKDEFKKSVTYKHLSSVVYNKKRYEFLSDFVPQKLRAQDALSEKALTET